jgi:hypothetical protein
MNALEASTQFFSPPSSINDAIAADNYFATLRATGSAVLEFVQSAIQNGSVAFLTPISLDNQDELSNAVSAFVDHQILCDAELMNEIQTNISDFF